MMIQLFITSSLLFLLTSSAFAVSPTYNVKNFGAKSDGKSDSTKAFLSAWSAACASTQPSKVYVPAGRYLIKKVIFDGNLCKTKAINFHIDGTLVAPSDYRAIGKVDSWLQFYRVTGISIIGGVLDGQGTSLWACKKSGKSCPKGSTSLAFHNSNNIVINGLHSLNSQMFHVLIDGCQNVAINYITIVAPGNSPNTDGIHVAQSSGVTIMNSHIGTGDDCVSIGPGTSNLWIESIVCGPGHGISIGSLGWAKQEAGVQNVTVRTATFTGTENGVRLKTWARPSNSFVKDVLFQHVLMVNVLNPIIIDQHYCPSHSNCPTQQSGVKISGITYKDVHGSSATQVAVKLDCSKTNPCKGIKMDGVHLVNSNEHPTASCANVQGTSVGVVQPMNCF